MAVTTTSKLILGSKGFELPSGVGAIDLLSETLRCKEIIGESWDCASVSGEGQHIQSFPGHAEWYAEVKSRVSKKGWHPDDLRVICSDRLNAYRLAAWLRKARHKDSARAWRKGEYVQAQDPVFSPAGEMLTGFNAEFQITLVRRISYGDTRGMAHWTTEKTKRQRELDLTIKPMPMFAVRLEPLAGGDPIAAVVEPPGRNDWREACKTLRQQLSGARHLPDRYEQALQWTGELQRQVIRLRSAAAITPQQIKGRGFAAVALHYDLLNAYSDEAMAETRDAVDCAIEELLLCEPGSLRDNW